METNNEYRKSNRMLLDERPLVLLPSLAMAVGVNEAIVIQQLHFYLADLRNQLLQHVRLRRGRGCPKFRSAAVWLPASFRLRRVANANSPAAAAGEGSTCGGR